MSVSWFQKLQDQIWNLLIQCISSDAKIFWILEQMSTSFVLYRLVIISNWLCSFECVLNMCLKKEKKLWHLRLDISCVEDAKKKKYNCAIFPFINDRCCFIVVNIVFHAPWSITCLSHVLILYIVYIWFHLCKKKPRHFIVYILRVHHKTNLYWGIEPLPTTYVCFFIIWIIFSL